MKRFLRNGLKSRMSNYVCGRRMKNEYQTIEVIL